MPKTKKKTKKKNAFELRLGNTEERSGHRRDCSQISARLVCRKDSVEDGVRQADAEAFLETLQGHVHDAVYEIEIWGGFTVEVTFNTARVTEKDVKEVRA